MPTILGVAKSKSLASPRQPGTLPSDGSFKNWMQFFLSWDIRLFLLAKYGLQILKREDLFLRYKAWMMGTVATKDALGSGVIGGICRNLPSSTLAGNFQSWLG